MSVLSVAYIKVDGELLASLPGATLDLGGWVRTPVAGANRMLGHTQAITPAMVECDIAIKQGVSLARLQAIKDATITFEGDTGQTWVIREAFCTETVKVSTGNEGKATLKFAGQPAEELVS